PLVGARAECNFPGIGRGQASPDEPLPHCCLPLVTRLCVAEEQNVPQLDRPAAVVLGKLVLIKLRKCGRESLLHLAGKQHTSILPVKGNDRGEFASTLDNGRERVAHQMTVRLLPRHLADKKKRRMTQLHFSTSLDSKRGHLFRRNLWYE